MVDRASGSQYPGGPGAGVPPVFPPDPYTRAPPPMEASMYGYPPLDDQLRRKGDAGTAARLVALACLLFASMVVSVLINASMLMSDHHFEFWFGDGIPHMMIVGSVSAGPILFLIVAFLLIRFADRSAHTYVTGALVGFLTCLLLGLVLTLLGVHLFQLSDSLGKQLLTNRCAFSDKSESLYAYHRVLENIKARCVAAGEWNPRQGVEHCAGFERNEYTAYLKTVEKDLLCYPLCRHPHHPMEQPGDVPGDSAVTMSVEQSTNQVTLHVDHGESGGRRHGDGDGGGDGGGGGGLFGSSDVHSGSQREFCYQAIAETMDFDVAAAGHRTFWTGVAYISITVFAAVMQFCSLTCARPFSSPDPLLPSDQA